MADTPAQIAAKQAMLKKGASYMPSYNAAAQVKPVTSGYGMSAGGASAAAINKSAYANNTANKAIAYKPTVYPSTNKTVTNQSSGNDSAKNAMLAWGVNYMPSASPGAQATGSQANQFQSQINSLGIGTGTGALWDYYKSQGGGSAAPSGGSSGGGTSWGGALGSALGGGSMGGSGLGSLGGMMGGGGLGGLGGAMGGGSSGGGYPAAEQPAEKPPEKPAPTRHWASGYTSTQQAAMGNAGTLEQGERLKAQYDAENLAGFKGMQSYDDLKNDRVKQAKALAERQGGQYDTEGNYYSKDVVKNVTATENAKKSKADANYYDTPSGAVPVAGNANDNVPGNSTGTSSGGAGGGAAAGGGDSLAGSDWLKKLAGMASGWLGGR